MENVTCAEELNCDEHEFIPVYNVSFDSWCAVSYKRCSVKYNFTQEFIHNTSKIWQYSPESEGIYRWKYEIWDTKESVVCCVSFKHFLTLTNPTKLTLNSTLWSKIVYRSANVEGESLKNWTRFLEILFLSNFRECLN